MLMDPEASKEHVSNVESGARMVLEINPQATNASESFPIVNYG